MVIRKQVTPSGRGHSTLVIILQHVLYLGTLLEQALPFLLFSLKAKILYFSHFSEVFISSAFGGCLQREARYVTHSKISDPDCQCQG